jgi:primosomal protein N' (replication factor Y)
MTFHQTERMMLCHHCRRFKQVPSLCPQCKGKYIYYVGEGTEKVQSMLQQLFPDHTVDRMDADTVGGKHGYFRILNGLLKGETDILVGTQMIAKGHDFPKVTLAAVVAADRALSVPDFRSAERTFQLLTQVAGRSGRGEIKGKVVIQTRYPNHYSLRCACRQDYAAFFREEIEYRRALGYPPFSFLAALLFREETLERVKKFSSDAGHVLQKVHGEMKLERRVRILGPNPSVLEKVKSQYRYQILIKAQLRKELVQFLRRGYEEWKREGLNPSRIAIDVDPQSML